MMALTGTILSYPTRGVGGDPKYRGNAAPQIFQDVVGWVKPKKVFIPFRGGGTEADVCERLGINHLALDLNPAYGGWDALNDDVPESSDLVYCHPPYHNMVVYSGEVWGQNPDPRDLSRCATYEDFISKWNGIQAKLMSSLRKGGYLAVLVGDYKKNGRLYSIQKDMAWLGTPVQVIIKQQHNCWSDKKVYAGSFIPIQHEYLLLFRRDDAYCIPVRVVKTVDIDLRTKVKQTWRDVVHSALEALGGHSTLDKLYAEIEGHAKCNDNPHWKEKIRQTLQRCVDFINTSRGEWAFGY